MTRSKLPPDRQRHIKWAADLAAWHSGRASKARLDARSTQPDAPPVEALPDEGAAAAERIRIDRRTREAVMDGWMTHHKAQLARRAAGDERGRDG